MNSKMKRQMDRKVDGQKDRQIDGRKNRQKYTLFIIKNKYHNTLWYKYNKNKEQRSELYIIISIYMVFMSLLNKDYFFSHFYVFNLFYYTNKKVHLENRF